MGGCLFFDDPYLSDEQRLMRETCRRYVDNVVVPFLRENRLREWEMDPGTRGRDGRRVCSRRPTPKGCGAGGARALR